jgi:TPR repeat protein
LLSILLIVNGTAASADHLKGRIVSVAGNRLQIRIDGDLLPQPGDPVAVQEVMQDGGLLSVQGQWKVTVVEREGVAAEPVGETGQPRKGQIAVITSSQPQTVGQLEQNAKELYDRGNDYYYGRNGRKQDYRSALELIHQAASLGYAAAQADLGFMYGKGKGVQQDFREAFVWTRKAAIQGNASAQYNLGLIYTRGQGVGEDPVEGAKWFLQAAKQGHTSSQGMLGAAYFNGSGVEQDYTAAAVWYEKAATGGDADAQCMLGLMYHDGQGVSKDRVKARHWFEKAANQNNVCGQKQLGFIYLDDESVPDHKRIAFGYFESAAKQGDAAGMRIVGMFYEKGYGVARDERQAWVWYRKAATQGDQEAQRKLKVTGTETPTKTRKGQTVGSNTPAGAQPYLVMLRSSNSGILQKGAKHLYNSSFSKDPRVLQQVRDTLLKGHKEHPRDRRYADAMAWLCNILGASGDRRYAEALETVGRESTNRKIKKFALKNLRRLR